MSKNKNEFSGRFGDIPEPDEEIHIQEPKNERDQLIEKICGEIKKKFTADEIERIAMRLLTHELIEEPPEMVKKYGKAMYQKGHLEKIGLEGYDYDAEQAWVMCRDDYYSKVVDSE